MVRFTKPRGMEWLQRQNKKERKRRRVQRLQQRIKRSPDYPYLSYFISVSYIILKGTTYQG